MIEGLGKTGFEPRLWSNPNIVGYENGVVAIYREGFSPRRPGVSKEVRVLRKALTLEEYLDLAIPRILKEQEGKF